MPRILVCTQIHASKAYAIELLQSAPVQDALGGYDWCIAIDSDEPGQFAVAKWRQVWPYIMPLLVPNCPPIESRTGRIARVRERQRLYAIERGYDYIYWHDADMIPQSGIIERMLKRDEPIVTGSYVVRNAASAILVMSSNINDAPGTLVTSTGLINDDLGLAKTARPLFSGMGCMLMRQDVFASVAFRDGCSWDIAPLQHGEDFLYLADWEARGGCAPLADFSEPVWHCSEIGVAVRPIVGDYKALVWYVGPSHEVHIPGFGMWRKGESRSDIPAAQVGTLGPQFSVQYGYDMSVEECLTADLL